MMAESMPLIAMASGLNESIGGINDRIFNVSLYAGLTEDVVKCCDGAPAAFHERLHVMQRRLYMDEECLLNYRVGGMEFSAIGEFDVWLSLPENRDRIMPFQRCLVGMQVRRNKKERASDGTLNTEYINFRLELSDKLTFLYIRNGDQVHRLTCDLEFDELIFPDQTTFDPREPMMMKMFGDRVDKMITVSDYEVRKARYESQKALSDQWLALNPRESWNHAANGPREWRDPHRREMDEEFVRPSQEWIPADPTSVYFDEFAKIQADRIKKYNRVALIIQGLFDRSDVLHPHPPVKTWSQEGFAAAIELVYDGTGVLHYAEAPDFEAYRAKCNASINANSVVTGQQSFWLKRELEKEARRRGHDGSASHFRGSGMFAPSGNEGPGDVSRMERLTRTGMATFSWYRKRRTPDDSWGSNGRWAPIRTTVSVPVCELFNVSAYVAGDYKQFFRDPRSRALYLKWAPMLLMAEEYLAGNIEVQAPVGEV